MSEKRKCRAWTQSESGKESRQANQPQEKAQPEKESGR